MNKKIKSCGFWSILGYISTKDSLKRGTLIETSSDDLIEYLKNPHSKLLNQINHIMFVVLILMKKNILDANRCYGQQHQN